MTYFTGLDRVAKQTGYPVVEVAGWKTRGHGHMGEALSVIVHHTAGGKNGNAPSLNVVTHGRTGLKGPLSHFVLGRDGTIYVVAAGMCAHAGKDSQVSATKYRNQHAIGIEAENTGLGEKWSAKQLDSYAKLCAALIKEFKLSVNDVQGHKEIARPKGRKIDPNFSANGIDMDDFRKMVTQALNDKLVTVKPVASKPKPATPKPINKAKKWPDANLPSTSKHTAASHAAWVALLNSVGYKNKDLTINMQQWLKKLDRYSGLVDGQMGSMTVKALQSFLKSKGLYKGLLDGGRGSMTIKAEIAYLNSQRKYL